MKKDNKISLSKRTKQAIELLDKADYNNPDRDQADQAEIELQLMGVVNSDGGIIDSEENNELNEWWEYNRC
jgi:hypothetical protein